MVLARQIGIFALLATPTILGGAACSSKLDVSVAGSGTASAICTRASNGSCATSSEETSTETSSVVDVSTKRLDSSVQTLDSATATSTGTASSDSNTDTETAVDFALAPLLIIRPSAITSDSQPTVEWEALAVASTYELRVCSPGNCAEPVQLWTQLDHPAVAIDALADGSYELLVTAYDQAGRTVGQSSEPFSLTVDTIPPASFAVAPQASPTNVATLSLGWGAAAGAASYRAGVAINSDCTAPVTSISGLTQLTLTLDALPDGSYHVCVDAEDLAGNITSASPVSVVIDTVPPATFGVSGPTTPGTSHTPTVSWDVAGGAALYDLVVAVGSDCSSPIQTYSALTATAQVLANLGDGTYHVCVSAKDDAQNTRVATNNGYAFVIDTTPPTIALGPRRMAGNSFALRPSTSDAGPVTYAWSTVSGPGAVTFGAPTSKDTLIDASVEGDYTLRLTATDQVGLSAQADVVVTWDRAKLVSAGRHHTCAIKAGGQLSCWGRNNSGEIGNGDGMMQTMPQAVDFGADRSVLSVAVGSFHTCAILDDASVRCWGSPNGNGYADGLLRAEPSPDPVDLGTGRSALALSAGFNHTCVILDDGSLKCWGDNTSGKLGYGDTTARKASEAAAVSLGSGRTAVEVSVGEQFSCVRLDDGSVKCWGANSQGQLGYGDTSDRYAPEPSPISLPGGLSAKQLETGRHAACAILSNDTLACWGNNSFGQLGDRSVTSRSSPVLVSSFTGTPKRLALGSGHSCALRGDGSVACWGNSANVNGAGRRAATTACTNGTSTSATACSAAGGTWSTHIYDCSNGASTSVSACNAAGGSWGSCSDFTKVSSGSCAGTWDATKFAYCSKPDGTQTAAAFCTSSGGAMSSDGYCSDPSYPSRAACLGASKTWHIARAPGPDLGFGAGRTVLALDSGTNGTWTCAVLDNMALKCWGDNTYGQLGYGDSNISTNFSAVDLGGGQTAQSVAVAGTHVCALTASGTVKCWGENSSGKLGTGTFNDELTPTAVTLASTATQVSTVSSHACAVLATGGIQCWGSNGSGRLGNGIASVVESASPVNVANLAASAVEVAAGSDFTCALLVGGIVKCWGNLANGRLGIGTTVAATACSDGIQATSGACTGAAGTWNSSLYWDCSNGISTSQAVCQAVANGTWAHCSDGTSATSGLCATASKVWDASLYNYCTSGAASTSATTFCANNGGTQAAYGYCSDPTYKSRSSCLNASRTWHVYTLPGAPVDLGGTPATQIVAGSGAACALLQGGSVRCWGSNASAQIGIGDAVTTNNYLVPAAAVDFGGRTAQRLTAASGNFCAILDDDSLRCWGYNGYSQLGHSATTATYAAPSAVSVDFGAGRTVRDVAADGSLTCVVLDDDTLRCVGNSGIRFSPNISVDDALSALTVALDLGTSTAPTKVSLGLTAICAVFADGSLRCGGQHVNGQPGQGLPTFRWLPPATAVLDLGM